MTHRSLMRTTWATAWLLVIGVAAWWFILPTSLGGRTSMVVTQGTSMQPSLRAGDLVVVRKTDAGELRTGDVVLYPATSIRRFVLHRIKAVDADGRLTMKGDNNDFLDPDHPNRSTVIGRKAFTIPGAGKLPGAGSPVVAGIATALMLLLLIGGFMKKPRRATEAPDSRRSTPAPIARSTSALPGGIRVINKFRLGAAIVVGAAAAAGVGALVLHAREITPPKSTSGQGGGGVAAAQDYSHVGAYSYEGREPNAAIQPDHRVSTGEAAFTNSVRKLAVKFDYHVEGKEAAQASGTARLDLSIEDDNGWHITQRLDSAKVQGGVTHLRGMLDLRALRSKLRAFEKASGTVPPLYRLRLQPHVKLDGSAPRPLAGATFEPELVMVLDSVRLRPETITGGDATKQYAPSAAIGDEQAAAAQSAPGAKRTTTRPVIYGAAVLVLLLGLGMASALGSGSVALRGADEPDASDEADTGMDVAVAAAAAADDHPIVASPAASSPVEFATSPLEYEVEDEIGDEIDVEPLRPPAAPRVPMVQIRRRESMSVGDRLEHEGIFYLSAAHTNFEAVPIHVVTEIEELTTLARMSNQAVIKHGRRGGNDWIVKTDHAHYVLREPGSDVPASHASSDADADARTLGRAA